MPVTITMTIDKALLPPHLQSEDHIGRWLQTQLVAGELDMARRGAMKNDAHVMSFHDARAEAARLLLENLLITGLD